MNSKNIYLILYYFFWPIFIIGQLLFTKKSVELYEHQTSNSQKLDYFLFVLWCISMLYICYKGISYARRHNYTFIKLFYFIFLVLYIFISILNFYIWLAIDQWNYN